VHQKAVLNDAATYEAHPLDQFGVTESEILLGPLSGGNVIYYFLKEIKYFQVDEATAKKIAQVFKERVYGIGPGESPAQILTDIAEKEFKLRRLEIPEPYRAFIVQRLDTRAESEGLEAEHGIHVR
jgi:homocitrate synthase